ncbi:quinone oxidoreductase [Epithele typhae]|uniref:quinone oxidoreductase n=1 Tax=Epithele typhae TaxID=378194 RepID=UPI0020087558|nr:quinone oxidoreductase [Epithele typhae]KAH9924685.1 quinone oxidoreductase [Epithele typhae]
MSSKMRAILVKDGKGPIENLFIGEAERPSPGPGMVLVKVKAFGLNGMDLLQREGRYPMPPSSPTIMGVEFSGTVVQPRASRGAYGEYVEVRHRNLIRKPAHLSWVDAAGIMENYITAFQGLVFLTGIKAGDDVLIHAGASGVGVAAIQLARFYGANTVIATASSKEKLDMLLAMPNGATHAVNYRTQDFAEEVKTITSGKGVDIVIDMVGQSHWQKNIASLAFDGQMALLAFLSGSVVKEVDLAPVIFKRLRIQGSTLRARSADYHAELIGRFKAEAFDSITGSSGDGRIRTYIHKVYPWTQIQEAHREMEASKNSGKIVLEFD